MRPTWATLSFLYRVADCAFALVDQPLMLPATLKPAKPQQRDLAHNTPRQADVSCLFCCAIATARARTAVVANNCYTILLPSSQLIHENQPPFARTPGLVRRLARFARCAVRLQKQGGSSVYPPRIPMAAALLPSALCCPLPSPPSRE